MDTTKVGPYTDAPDSLEKGCLETDPLHPDVCHAHPEPVRRQSIAKRHLIVFGSVALTWLACSYGMHAFNQPRHELWDWASDKFRPPPPEDGDVDRFECMGGTNWTTFYDQPPWTPEYPYGAETAFSLPLDAEALYLISRGPFQRGQVNVEQSTDVADTVDVRVRVAYFDDKMLDHATVCRLGRSDREHGVGIFTPPWAPHRPRHKRRDQLEFDVTVTLPAGNDGPLSVKKLETKMPDYSQNVADLEASVVFDEISLTSASGRLNVQSVTSDVGQFSLLNGEIEGRFNARSSLELRTINGRIAPTVNVLHREGAEPSKLAMHTINGKIDAQVSLASETSNGGEFEVGAELSRGEVTLKFVDTPVDSVLRCHAETRAGKVAVELDDAFEGTYSLRSVLGAKLVSQSDAEDPTGRGRHRVVTLNEAGRQVEGEVRWVESDGSTSGKEGYVALKAITASLQLVV